MAGNCRICEGLRSHFLRPLRNLGIRIVMRPTRGAPVVKSFDYRKGKWIYLTDGTRVHVKDILTFARQP